MAEHFKYSFQVPERAELSLVVHNTGYQKCTPGHKWGPGVRDHYLLHYVVSGKGIYEVKGYTFHLAAGDIFLARPDDVICYYADQAEPWEYDWVGFSGAVAPLLLAQTPFTPQKPVLHPGSSALLRQGFLDIYAARGTDYPSAVRMAGYLQAAIGLLMAPGVHRGEEMLLDYANRGAAFMQRNYSNPIGVDETALQIGISRSHLYRAFRAAFGCSPNAYLTRLRIQRAEQLLRHSMLTVGEIAASVGFEDPYYFSRVFRKQTGQNPTEYRHLPHE